MENQAAIRSLRLVAEFAPRQALANTCRMGLLAIIDLRLAVLKRLRFAAANERFNAKQSREGSCP